MFLFRMANPASSAHDQGKVVYVIESNGVNDRLWNREILLRDTVVTIGTFVLMRSPNEIENYLGDDIPIIVSSYPLYVLKKPCMDEVIVDPSLVEGVTQAFVLKTCTIEVLNSTPIVTKCSGLFCDRQNTIANLKNSKTCGCYIMDNRTSNLVYQHKIQVSYKNEKLFTMNNFSSYKFDEMFLSENFSKSVNISDLEKDNIVENFNDAIDAMTDYVNTNGGFTVYSWYKRGEKDDKSSDEDAKTGSSEFIYHIVHLHCTTESVQNGHIVESLKFDTANIYFYSKK